MPNLIIVLDIAKNIFQVYRTNHRGIATIKRKLCRNNVLSFFATLEQALIGNDTNDAAAICMAVTRPDIHCVPKKSAEQQSLQSLHRTREGAIQARTAKSNQIRSLFSEEGVIFPTGLSSLKKGLFEFIEDGESAITPILRNLGMMYLEQLSCLQTWISELNEMIDVYFKDSDVCQRLTTIPGIGPVIARISWVIWVIWVIYQS